MKMPVLSVIIPVLNEEKMLGDTVKNLKKYVRNSEIIIIWDVTKPELKNKLMKESRKIRRLGAQTIFRFNEMGFGSALRLGFEKSKGSEIMVMMGDMCDDPRTIIKMMEKMKEGYGIVAGSRFMEGGAIIGSAKGGLSNIVSKMIRIFSKVKCTDITNAFRLYSKKVIENISTETNSFDISTEITLKAAKAGFMIGEVPTTWTNKDAGKTNFSPMREAKRYFKHFLFAATMMPSFITKFIIVCFFIFAIYAFAFVL